MYLSKIKIENYRSIESQCIEFCKGMNIIVGRNNSGKSNIIKAIDLVLGDGSPTYSKSQNIDEDDFFIKDGQRAGCIKIICDLEKEETDKFIQSNFEDYYIKLFTKTTWKDGQKDGIEDIKDSTIQGTLSKINERDFRYIKNDQLINFLNSMSNIIYYFESVIDGGYIKKDLKILFYNGNDYFVGTSAIRNELIKSAIIPSFRDPINQLKLNSYSWYGKLMQYMILNASKKDDLFKAFDRVNQVSSEIFNEVKGKIQNEALTNCFPDTEIFFQLNADNNKDIYKNTQIYIKDGCKTLLSEKGSGIQSATIIGLFAYYVKYVDASGSCLLCVEEPELFMHPHGCRTIRNNLKDFLYNENGTLGNQIIITTHNPEFINTVNDTNLILVKKNNHITQTDYVKLGDYKRLAIDGFNHSEIFFSDSVIVCEGFDGYLIKMISDQLYAGILDKNNVSVISVYGKDNIKEYVKLLRNLKIKTYIVADFDYCLRDKDDEKCNKYNCKKHDNIESILSILNVSKNLRSTMDGCRNYIKEQYEELFYKSKNISDFSKDHKYEKFKRLLVDLRTEGIFILEGEIENLFIDDTIISPGDKLSIEKIFKLNTKLKDGVKISELVNTEPIGAFLSQIA